jgi:hypothetical protein
VIVAALRWALAAVAALAALVLAAIGAFWLGQDVQMDRHGVTAEATVLSIDDTYGTFEATYLTPEGFMVADVSYWDEAPVPDDVVTVEYDPQDVGYARLAGSNEDFYLALALFAVAYAGLIAAVGATLWAVFGGRRDRRRAAQAAAFHAGHFPYAGQQPWGAPGHPYTPPPWHRP